MSSSSGHRALYRDLIPYETPDSLDQLRGPRHGLIRLPLHIHWGPDPTANLTPRAVAKRPTPRSFKRIQKGRGTQPLGRSRCRMLWESKFPELTGQ
jgi:hypothetical protein